MSGVALAIIFGAAGANMIYQGECLALEVYAGVPLGTSHIVSRYAKAFGPLVVAFGLYYIAWRWWLNRHFGKNVTNRPIHDGSTS